MTEAQREGLEYFTQSGKRSELKTKILSIINVYDNLTDREIAKELEQEINAITRARYDLVEAGRIKEFVKRRCKVTRANAMSWCLGKQLANTKPLTNIEMKHIFELSKRATKQQKQQMVWWFY